MCLKRRHSVPIVFLTSPRGRIRHVVFVCSSHRDTFPVHFFTLAPFFAFSLICLSYINKSFIMKMNKWVAFFPARNCKVTFFMKRSYLLPRENFNCHISRTRHTGIPVFAFRWYLVTSILYTKNRANSWKGTWGIWPLFVSFDPAAAARGRR